MKANLCAFTNHGRWFDSDVTRAALDTEDQFFMNEQSFEGWVDTCLYEYIDSTRIEEKQINKKKL